MHIKLIGPLNSQEVGGRGNYYLFLLILCLLIYYWQCLGFRSPQKGMLISVLSPVGYFFTIFLTFLRPLEHLIHSFRRRRFFPLSGVPKSCFCLDCPTCICIQSFRICHFIQFAQPVFLPSLSNLSFYKNLSILSFYQNLSF